VRALPLEVFVEQRFARGLFMFPTMTNRTMKIGETKAFISFSRTNIFADRSTIYMYELRDHKAD